MIEEAPSKKKLIFIEAAHLFQSKGYAATSMRELATKVGLKPSSFYSHIKSKEEILEKICMEAADRFLVGLEEIKATTNGSFERWTRIVDLHIDIAFANPSAITVFNDEWRHLTGDALDTFRQKRKAYQAGVVEIIRAAIADQQLQDLDATLMFNTMIGATRWLHFISSPGAASAERIREQINSLLLNGMKKQ